MSGSLIRGQKIGWIFHPKI